jgi:hypothetical protein
MGYENHQDFAAFVAHKTAIKVSFDPDQSQTGGVGIPIGIEIDIR